MVETVKPKINDLYRLYSAKGTIIRVSVAGRYAIKYIYVSSDITGFDYWLLGAEFECSPWDFRNSFEKIVSPSEIWKSLNEA